MPFNRTAEDLANSRIGRHGAALLLSVEVDSYRFEPKDDDGFLGDRVSKGAFRAVLDEWRKPLKKTSDDPFGNKSLKNI